MRQQFGIGRRVISYCWMIVEHPGPEANQMRFIVFSKTRRVLFGDALETRGDFVLLGDCWASRSRGQSDEFHCGFGARTILRFLVIGVLSGRYTKNLSSFAWENFAPFDCPNFMNLSRHSHGQRTVGSTMRSVD